jgi:nucleotide-binding universal stress UspA family protein
MSSPAPPTLIGAAVDGTPSGRDAVALASLLASPSGAELMLIAVHDEPLVLGMLPRELSWSTVEKEARTMLAKTRDALAPDARIVVESDVLVWRALSRVVEREHRDLLVVGSALRADDGHVRLGKTAGELLGHLRRPLAVAPSGLCRRPDTSLKRIGVGFDDSSRSRAALDWAVSMAAAAGASVLVRGVVNDTVAGGLRTEQIVLTGDSIVQRQLVSAFERDLAAVRGVGVPTRLEVQAGRPSQALSEFSEQVDLLVIGSSRRSGAGRVQPGETGQALLREARCPVVIVPRPVG